MFKSILMALSLCLQASLYAASLDLEKDPVFKALIHEFQRPGTNLTLYQESQNYRFDLSLIDLVDSVGLITNNKKFRHHESELSEIIQKGGVYFHEWYQKLNELADRDPEFEKALNRKLRLQLYSKNGLALLPEYKFIDFKKLKQLGLLRRITRYNEVVSDPEGPGILSLFELEKREPFATKALTVSKMKEVSKREIRKLKKAYYKTYKTALDLHYKEKNSDQKYTPLTFTEYGGSYVQARTNTQGKVYSYQKLEEGLKVFNIIQRLPQKQDFKTYIGQALEEKGIESPKILGLVVFDPIFIERNWEAFHEAMQDYTLERSIDLSDDEYLLLVRRWMKKNYEKIQNAVDEYNESGETLSINFREDKKPRRIEALTQYAALEELFPDRPWLKDGQAHLIDRKGRKRYFDISFGKKVGLKLKNLLRAVTKVENYTSALAAGSVFALSGGNVSFAMSTRSLIKSAVYNLKHDKEWEEFLRKAPMQVLTAFLGGAGFTPGRLYKILALGSAGGALQSAVTGQDPVKGAVVGAALNAAGHYLLPSSIYRPMTKGTDAYSLRMNRYLEVASKTFRSSAQGAMVAGLSGEDLLSGAAKGAAYGSLSSALTIWLLGTRYHPFKDYTEQEISKQIAEENEFQNMVGRGHYAIDRQLILDANYRVGGALPPFIAASITLPGNVSMGKIGFNRLSTLTHEASHLMQQHQSGVFGFYLFRYIPAAFKEGFTGHPDENYLGRALDYMKIM